MINEPRLDTPVGATEVARWLDVQPATVAQWRQRALDPPFPEPDWTVGGRPAWRWSRVRGWARVSGRLPARLKSELSAYDLIASGTSLPALNLARGDDTEEIARLGPLVAAWREATVHATEAALRHAEDTRHRSAGIIRMELDNLRAGNATPGLVRALSELIGWREGVQIPASAGISYSLASGLANAQEALVASDPDAAAIAISQPPASEVLANCWPGGDWEARKLDADTVIRMRRLYGGRLFWEVAAHGEPVASGVITVFLWPDTPAGRLAEVFGVRGADVEALAQGRGEIGHEALAQLLLAHDRIRCGVEHAAIGDD